MSDAYVVVYSPKAKQDLKEIYSYIAFELLAKNSAQGQVNRIRKTIRSLGFMPARNPIVEWEPWKSMEVHKVSVDNFVVFYTINDSTSIVTVIRIVYGKRDIAGMAADIETE